MFRKIGKFAKRSYKHVKNSKFGKGVRHAIHSGGHLAKVAGKGILHEGKTIGKNLINDVKKVVKDPIGTAGVVADAFQKTGGDPFLLTLGAVHPDLYNKVTPMVSGMRDIAGKVVEQATGGEIPADTFNSYAKKGVDFVKGLKPKKEDKKHKYLEQAEQFALTYAPEEIKKIVPDAVKIEKETSKEIEPYVTPRENYMENMKRAYAESMKKKYQDYLDDMKENSGRRAPEQRMIIDDPKREDNDNKSDISNMTNKSDISYYSEGGTRRIKKKQGDDSAVSVNDIPYNNDGVLDVFR